MMFGAKRPLALVFLALFIPLALGGTEQNRGRLSLQLSTLPEAKLSYARDWVFPFLAGESPLTRGNNLTATLSAEVSPVSLNGLAKAVWTPAAFCYLAAGGRMGTGWSIKLFGKDVRGIGVNKAAPDGKAVYAGSAFDGLLWNLYGGGALQFDLAALVPGEWNHLVARTYHEINYKGYTAAGPDESWYYENDGGENVNGFNYYGNFLWGYQMPLVLNTVGLLAEADVYLNTLEGRERWGDGLPRWTFSVLGNFTITKKLGAALLAQFRTQRNFTTPNWDKLYYRARRLDRENPLELKFYRVAAIMTLTL